tara:strand:- start:102 stop:3176 length:3075 start_codon:yes stop_codon:yes gene_type:complete
MGASALLKPIKKPVVDYVRKKIVEYSDDLMEPKVVDNIAAEVSDSIEKFAEKKQIPVEDKVKRDSLYKYGAKILEREIWTSPIDRVKGDVDKLTDEDWSELNKRGNEHIKLRDQHDESEELDSEITAKLLQKHSDILHTFKFFKEEIDIEVDPDLDKFIDMQLSRHSGYNKLNLDKKEHFRKLAQKTLREHPLTKDFRGQPPTITKAGTEEPDAAYQETEELVDSSSVKVPAYRGFASGGEYDWDQRYPFANEVGVHSGELGQAYSIIIEKMSKELKKDKDYVMSKVVEKKIIEEEYQDDYYRDEQFDDFPKDYDEEVYYPIQEEGHILEEDIDELLDPDSMSIAYRGGQPWSQAEIDWRTKMYHELRNPDTPMKPFQITKGWVRIRNPLVFAFDEPGNWNAADILQPTSDGDKYNFLLSNFLQAMAQTIGKKFEIDASQLERLDKLQKKAKDLEDFHVLNLKNKFDDQPNVRYINELIHLFGTYNINKDFQRWLGSFGFDGIKYVNIKETPMAGSTDHLIDNEEVIRKYNPTGFQEEAIKHQGDRYWSYITFNPQQFKTVGKARYNIEDPRQNYVEGGRVRAASGWNWAKLFSFEKEPKMWIHEVKKGDTLSQIAKQFGKSVEEIAKVNNIKDVNKIYVGDKFIIPKEETQKPKVKTTQTIRRPPQQKTTPRKENIITDIEEQVRKNIEAGQRTTQQKIAAHKEKQQKQQQQKRSNIIAIDKPKNIPNESIWQQAKDTVSELFNIEVQDIGTGITDRAKARQEILQQKRQSIRRPAQPEPVQPEPVQPEVETTGVTTRRTGVSSLLNPLVRGAPFSTPEKVYLRSFFDKGVWDESFLEDEELKYMQNLATRRLNQGKKGISYSNYNKQGGKGVGYSLKMPDWSDISERLKFTFGKVDLVRDGNNLILPDEYDLPTGTGGKINKLQGIKEKTKYLTNAVADYFTTDDSGRRKISTAGLAHKIGEVLGPSEGTGPSLRVNLGTPESLGLNKQMFNNLPTLEEWTKTNQHRIRQRPISNFFASIFD